MSETPLMRLDGLELIVEPSSLQLRSDLLGASEMVQVVNDTATNQMAFEAQAAILGLVRAVQKTQSELKKPLNDLRGRIDQAAKDFIDSLQKESMRLAGLMGSWHSLEEQKRRSAEAARMEELKATERAREAEIAKAKSLEHVAEIKERYEQSVLTIAAPPPTEKPSAQIVKDVWKMEVTDIWLLARMHPACVKIEPRKQEIIQLLDAGFEVAGVKSWREKSVTARTA